MSGHLQAKAVFELQTSNLRRFAIFVLKHKPKVNISGRVITTTVVCGGYRGALGAQRTLLFSLILPVRKFGVDEPLLGGTCRFESYSKTLAPYVLVKGCEVSHEG